ncbi:uncharacterized protein SPSK_07898 [Sporothrix schenckii 1099-18]|uniref:Superoxide dismutase 1 copper chaperone n=1 Tax=Sporothrix schenckii 1099-18 TaxID=1397361 RepID=A0A0F2MHR8_SPOSC|nr:uncharacterized protein SPSK_07898 [Sporothrix schenckii 1099-18]KJR88405.1 hypothetical protein SPSK_07898 [Sporothrix schenckii 1099-18]
MKTANKYFVGTISGFALTAVATGYLFRRGPASTTDAIPKNAHQGVKPTMTVTHSFRTLFAVPLSCDGCVKDVSDALYKVSGISKVEGNLKDQLVSIEGTAPPSAIVKAIQETGRDAILRGSGTSNKRRVYEHRYSHVTGPGSTQAMHGPWSDDKKKGPKKKAKLFQTRV